MPKAKATGSAALPIEVNIMVTTAMGMVRASSQPVARGRIPRRSRAIPRTVDPTRVSRRPGMSRNRKARSRTSVVWVHWVQ